MYNIVFSLGLLILSGCASFPRMIKAPVPPSLTQPCPKLPKLSNPEMGAMLSNHVETAEMYYECAAKHNALSELVK